MEPAYVAVNVSVPAVAGAVVCNIAVPLLTGCGVPSTVVPLLKVTVPSLGFPEADLTVAVRVTEELVATVAADADRVVVDDVPFTSIRASGDCDPLQVGAPL